MAEKNILVYDVTNRQIEELQTTDTGSLLGPTKFGSEVTDKHQFTGSVNLMEGNISNLSLSFGDDDTGFYENGNQINIVNNGSSRFRFTYDGFFAPGRAFVSSTGVSSTSPGFTFDNDTNTGLGKAEDGELSLIANGMEGLRVNANELEIQPMMTLVAGPIEFEEDSGAITAMDMPVSSTPNLGDEMSYTFSIDSNPVLKIKGSADGISGADEFQILVPKGSPNVPGFSFIDDPHTGFYNSNSGFIQFRSNGTSGPILGSGILFGNADKPYFVNAVSSDTVPVLLPAQGDINTGIGHAGTNQLSLIAGGVEATRLTDTATETRTGIIRNTTIVNSSTYDLLATDDILLVTYTNTGTVTSLTLPSIQTVEGRVIVIKDAGGNSGINNIIIDTEGDETIDGEDSVIINSNYTSITLICDGSNWFII